MSTNVIRFDNYHPNFQGPRVMQPGIQFELYSHGLYLGFVRLVPGIEAFGRNHEGVGNFGTVDEAIDFLIAEVAEGMAASA